MKTSKLMRHSLLFLLFVISTQLLHGQATEATLLYNWQDDNITETTWLSSRYNEIWGVAINDREIAIIGSTEGVHFIDVTEDNNMYELPNTFVAGGSAGTNLVHRDYHDYNGYLYTVADEGGNSKLQIIDLNDLPNSTSIVYDDDEFIKRSHNIFIDSTSARLYACGVRDGNNAFSSITILSLDNPTQPTLLGTFNSIQGFPLAYAHDVFVNNDTAFINGSNDGLFIVDFTDLSDPYYIGSMTDYPDQGYNHAGWLHPDGQVYYLADETHGMDLKAVDVSDYEDIEVATLFDADGDEALSIAHNPIVKCNRLYVSYYYQGLQVFDLTDPLEPTLISYYDTFDGRDSAFYAGAWGIYPFLPSGKMLLSDMQTGLYVFAPISEECDPVSTSIDDIEDQGAWTIAPNPVLDEIKIQDITDLLFKLELVDINGRLIIGEKISALSDRYTFQIPKAVSNGIYFIKGYTREKVYVQKVIISR